MTVKMSSAMLPDVSIVQTRMELVPVARGTEEVQLFVPVAMPFVPTEVFSQNTEERGALSMAVPPRPTGDCEVCQVVPEVGAKIVTTGGGS